MNKIVTGAVITSATDPEQTFRPSRSGRDLNGVLFAWRQAPENAPIPTYQIATSRDAMIRFASKFFRPSGRLEPLEFTALVHGICVDRSHR
jgi:hypothetical protein